MRTEPRVGVVTRGATVARSPRQDLRRRAAYEALCRGSHVDGPRGRVVMCVYTVDLDEGRGDVYVAAGLGLSLVERGYGVELVPRDKWHLVGSADVFVAMMPDVHPGLAPPGAWKLAWVRNETDRWCATSHVIGFDQVVASSELASRRLRRVTPRAEGTLRIGVDTALFSRGADRQPRSSTAVTTAHYWGRVRQAHRALMGLADSDDVVMYGHAAGAPPELLRWHRPAVPYFALPEVYRSAAIVVDDMNLTTVGYGSLNSRFFESAASGCLPVLNSLLGAVELDLAWLPHYTDSESLSRTLDALRRDPQGLAEQASRLQEVVIGQHGWDARAEEFEEALERGRAARSSRAPRTALDFCPDGRGRDRAQDRLHAGLATVDAYPSSVRHLLKHLRQRVERLGDPGVLELHGTAQILQPTDGPFRTRLALDRIFVLLDDFLARGGRLIWTVRTLPPTDAPNRWAERELARGLATRAALVQVPTEAMRAAVQQRFDLARDAVLLIEDAGSVEEYPQWITRAGARRRLGLAEHERVLVTFVGEGSPDGLQQLLDVFEQVASTSPSWRLLLASRVADGLAENPVLERCASHPRVLLSTEPVRDDQLQVWMKAADLAVVPDQASVDAGGLALARSFGLPAVVASSASTPLAADRSQVIVFDPTSAGALDDAVRLAQRVFVDDVEGDPQAHVLSAATSRSRSTEQMAASYAEAIEPLLRRPVPGPSTPPARGHLSSIPNPGRS